MKKKMVRVMPELCTGCTQCELVCSINKTGMANPLLARIKVVKDEKGVFAPIVCRQCDPAPCMDACPKEAIVRSLATGAMLINEQKCIKCKVCVTKCPFGAISITPEGEIIVCDLCGGDPTCVRFCKERPEDTCAYLSNPRASALDYLELTEVNRFVHLRELKKVAREQEKGVH